jgi:hypothetical protein
LPAEAETLAKVQKWILGGITRSVSYRIKQLERETPPDGGPPETAAPLKRRESIIGDGDSSINIIIA